MYEAIVVCFVVCLVFFTCMFFMDLCGLIQINDDDSSGLLQTPLFQQNF